MPCTVLVRWPARYLAPVDRPMCRVYAMWPNLAPYRCLSCRWLKLLTRLYPPNISIIVWLVLIVRSTIPRLRLETGRDELNRISVSLECLTVVRACRDEQQLVLDIPRS